MDKIKMRCNRCDFVGDIHSADLKETKAKVVPSYNCPKCTVGSLKQVDDQEKD